MFLNSVIISATAENVQSALPFEISRTSSFTAPSSRIQASRIFVIVDLVSEVYYRFIRSDSFLSVHFIAFCLRTDFGLVALNFLGAGRWLLQIRGTKQSESKTVALEWHPCREKLGVFSEATRGKCHLEVCVLQTFKKIALEFMM